MTAFASSIRNAPYARYMLAAALPLLAGVVAQALSVWFGVTQLSFVFMTSVLFAGAFFGARPAVFAAAIAFAIYNFFLVEPRFSLGLASADDFTTLVLFLVAAIVTGGLAGRMRDQSLLSAQRLRITQALFEASRRIANAMEERDILRTVVDSAALALSSPTIGLTHRTGEWAISAGAPDTLEPSKADIEMIVAAIERPPQEHSALWAAAPIEGRRGLIGALALSTKGPLHDEERALSSFANLAAVALERVELINAMAEAQALAESERLRAALLSSLSHDFRTPLAAILASATTLETYGNLSDEARGELLASIRIETEHMTRFVANLLDMTKLEAGALRPRLTRIDLSHIITDAAAHAARQAQAKGVRIHVSGGAASAAVDPVLLERALINILENAISFSRPGQNITMALDIRGDAGIIAITDQGPGIPTEALGQIFEKFYRAGDQTGQRRGAGLGLSIAKGFVEAMNGTIIAANNKSTGNGARFEITFPLTDAS